MKTLLVILTIAALVLVPRARAQVSGWGSGQLINTPTNTPALDIINNSYFIRHNILSLQGSNGMVVTGFTANIFLGPTAGNTSGAVLLGSITLTNFTSITVTNQSSYTNPPLYIFAQGLPGTNAVYASFIYGP